jgi:hypothetical protein
MRPQYVGFLFYQETKKSAGTSPWSFLLRIGRSLLCSVKAINHARNRRLAWIVQTDGFFYKDLRMANLVKLITERIQRLFCRCSGRRQLLVGGVHRQVL